MHACGRCAAQPLHALTSAEKNSLGAASMNQTGEVGKGSSREIGGRVSALRGCTQADMVIINAVIDTLVGNNWQTLNRVIKCTYYTADCIS